MFDNLPLIFAVGVAIGMAKKEKEVSALSALIAYFVMNVAINGMLVVNGNHGRRRNRKNVLEGTVASVCGIQSQMGVFGGIIVGLGVAALHANRFTRSCSRTHYHFRRFPVCTDHFYNCIHVCRYRNVLYWPPVQNGITLWVVWSQEADMWER